MAGERAGGEGHCEPWPRRSEEESRGRGDPRVSGIGWGGVAGAQKTRVLLLEGIKTPKVVGVFSSPGVPCLLLGPGVSRETLPRAHPPPVRCRVPARREKLRNRVAVSLLTEIALQPGCLAHKHGVFGPLLCVLFLSLSPQLLEEP